MKITKRLTMFLLVLAGSTLLYHFSQRNEAKAEVSQFPVPSGLEPSVNFWKRVFLEFGNQELIFFSTQNPNRIYKVFKIRSRSHLRRLIRAERRKIVRKYGLKSTKSVSAQRGIKGRFLSGLKRSHRHIDQIQTIFRKKDLPIGLAYLPLVESSFDINARSHAGAVGMWQLMRNTGKRFLHVSSRLDERKDPLESTRAAARLLEENFEKFKSWPLAITAYNHGLEGISRGVRRVGSKDLMELIKHYKSRTFGYSSKNFYAEFLAALEIAQNAQKYFPGIDYEPVFTIGELKLERPIPLSLLLRSTNVSRKEFLAWNPALNRRITYLPHWYRIKFPVDRKPVFAAAYHKIVSPPWIFHEVSRGETLSHIARQYGVTVGQVQMFNGLSNVHFIYTGQRLKIPR